jgi:hypothetical protein
MEKEIYIKKGWLFIPVCATYGELPFGGKKNNRMLEMFCREDNSETKLLSSRQGRQRRKHTLSVITPVFR